MTRVSFRPTAAEDIGWVVSLEAREDISRFISPWLAEEHARVLSRGDWAHWLVQAEPGATRSGFVLLAGLGTPDIELRRLVVETPGRGLGRAVIRLIKELAFGEWRAARLWLDVFDFNVRALALYRSEGFRQVSSAPGEPAGGLPGSRLLILEMRAPDRAAGGGATPEAPLVSHV